MITWLDDFLAIAEASDKVNHPAYWNNFIDVRAYFNEDGPKLELLQLIDWILKRLANGQACILYCDDGIEQSPFVAALVLANFYGTTLQFAYDYVKERRPQVIQHLEWLQQLGLEVA